MSEGKQIDWSKAPEGATHQLVCWGGNRQRVWARVTGDSFDRWAFGAWEASGTQFSASNFAAVFERPTTWAGEGLPPVGTVCEFLWNYHTACSEYVTVRVVAHDEGRAIVRVTGEGAERRGQLRESSGGCCGPSAHCHPVFRPIRTPEQIAAEEREKAVDALCSTIVAHYEAPKMSEHYLGLARTLYDAGYRKAKGEA